MHRKRKTKIRCLSVKVSTWANDRRKLSLAILCKGNARLNYTTWAWEWSRWQRIEGDWAEPLGGLSSPPPKQHRPPQTLAKQPLVPWKKFESQCHNATFTSAYKNYQLKQRWGSPWMLPPVSNEPVSGGCLSKEPLSGIFLSKEPLSCGCLSKEPLSGICLSKEPLSCGCLSKEPLSGGCLSKDTGSPERGQGVPLPSSFRVLLLQDPESSPL